MWTFSTWHSYSLLTTHTPAFLYYITWIFIVLPVYAMYTGRFWYGYIYKSSIFQYYTKAPVQHFALQGIQSSYFTVLMFSSSSFTLHKLHITSIDHSLAIKTPIVSCNTSFVHHCSSIDCMLSDSSSYICLCIFGYVNTVLVFIVRCINP